VRPDELQPKRDSGRKGYREPHEPRDERPVLSCNPFWESMEEQETYEAIARFNRRKPSEFPSAYIERIASLAAGKLAGSAKVNLGGIGRPMPHDPTPSETSRRIAELEEQRYVIREPGEEG
jgi:hypothetical protein